MRLLDFDFGALVNDSTDFVGIASLQGQLLYVNPSGRRLVGFDCDEQVHATQLHECVVDDEREHMRNVILPAVVGHGRWEGEVCFRHFGSGAAVAMLHHMFVVHDPATAERLALATIGYDITRRTQEQEELERAKDAPTHALRTLRTLREFGSRWPGEVEVATLLEEVLAALMGELNAVGGHVHVYDERRQVLELAARRGCASGGLPWLAAMADPSAPHQRSSLRLERVVVADVRTDVDSEPQREATAAAGTRAVHATPLIGRGGDLLGVISICFADPYRPSVRDLYLTDMYALCAVDLIERKRAQDLLQRHQVCLAEAQRLSHTGSWSWNIVTGAMFWSAECFRIFGLDPQATTPTYEMLFASVVPDDRDVVLRTFEAAIRAGAEFDHSYRIMQPDGEVRHVRSLAHPVAGEAEKWIEYVGTVIDITERRVAEDRLRAANAEIELLRERLAQEKHYLQEEIRIDRGFEHIVGESPALQLTLEQIQTVAPTDSTVLILGETGTGKELFARAIHARSSRSCGTFVKVNCAAMPGALLESELFGHERGAFTGAVARRIGRFELAHGGTIFLDEVGEIPVELQPKLLRVLQEHEFERVGGAQTIRADVRVISATNRDLLQMVADKQFRSDLYYRLNVFPITVPPLRERGDDVPRLAHHFVQKHARRMNKTIVAIAREAMAALCNYGWPGNVRELENFIERAVILARGPTLEPPLGELLQYASSRAAAALAGEAAAGTAATTTPANAASAGTVPGTLAAVERQHILCVLDACRWVIGGPAGAAARLGMKRTSLQYRMRKLEIRRPIDGLHPAR